MFLVTLKSYSLQNEVEVVLVNTVEEVLQAAFDEGFPDIFAESDDGTTKPMSSKL